MEGSLCTDDELMVFSAPDEILYYPRGSPSSSPVDGLGRHELTLDSYSCNFFLLIKVEIFSLSSQRTPREE